MKKILYRILQLSIVTAGFALMLRAQETTITLLHFNDTHSNLSSIGPRNAALEGSLGGAARAATWIKMYRQVNPNVLLLHAGDSFIGDIFFNTTFGAAELQLMLGMGFDAMTVGNHEFDLTPGVLLQSLSASFAQGSFPLLSANLVLEDSTVQPLKQFIQPYTIRQFDGARVGIFGLTTPATNILSNPAPAFVDTNIVEIAAAMVDTLASKGCNVIICLSHLGVLLDQIIASYVPGIHVIVGGHDHYALERPAEVTNPTGQKTFIVQANAFYLNMGKLRLRVSGANVTLLDYELIKIDQSLPEEAEVSAAVAALRGEIEGVYGPVFSARIGYATERFEEVASELDVVGKKDTPVGNLVTDAFRATTGTDVAIQVGGSTAQPFYKGPIVSADAFRVVGYGFNTDNGLGYRLATFKIKGQALQGALEYCLAKVGEDNSDEFLPQVSGMSYTYESNYRAGELSTYRISRILVGNAALNSAQTYSVTANEFVPMFLTFLGIPFEDLHIFSDTTEFQILAGYIAQLDTIRPNVEGRVRCVKTTSVAQESSELPREFVLHQNYPNPFNPTTTIRFDLPQASFVTLKVFNILGQEVAALVEGQLEAGTYQRAFEAIGFGSGAYVYRLQAGDWKLSRRMILLR
ncbi:MAG TPA: hypothetical protein DCP63_09560 [Bacteroidetes bacterium]|nr:hypothetical protein [Bacteroidota bacterium]